MNFTKILLLMLAFAFAGSLSAQQNATIKVKDGMPIMQNVVSTTATNGADIDFSTYCIPGGDCSYDDGFTDFAFAGIENYGSGCSAGGYGDFTAMVGTVELGQTYTATMASGYSSNFASIWIDFDMDYEFEEWERILTDYELGDPGQMMEVDITIPGYGQPGTTVMRIGAAWSEPSSPNPCANLTYGEWEDYTITVTGTSTSLDAIAISIDNPYIVEAGDVYPMATVMNGGIETVSFSVTCNIDGYSSVVQVTDLPKGQEQQLTFDAWAAAVGDYLVEVTTDLTGDENPENDQVTTNISVVDYVPEKMIVGEEGTGTWCGWCIRGLVYMDSMRMKYPDSWIGIAVHNGDPMVVPAYDAGVGPLIGNAYPGGLVDRFISVDPSGFEGAFLNRMEAIPSAGLMIDNKNYNPTTGELTFTLTADFIVDVTDYRLSAVIIEHDVTGTGSGYAQANYYAGGGYGPMGGYENLPNPVPAEDMVYEDVARALLGDFDGFEGSLPASITAGESHSWEFSVVLDEEWEMEHMQIVGMLIDYANGSIENGTVDDVMVGIPEEYAKSNVKVFPNPATTQLHFSNVEGARLMISSTNGQLVFDQENVIEKCTVDVSGLMNGTYIVKIINDDTIITRKVVIIR